MNIGILTYHCAQNYGAVLQAYALQRYLTDTGHVVSVIDYRPDFLVLPYTLFRWNCPLGGGMWRRYRRLAGILLYGLLFLLPRWLRRSRFARFIRKKLHLSRFVHEPEDVTKMGFDAVIVGSDQVWNILFSPGPDPFYFARFPSYGGRRIAYAASAGGAEMALLRDEKCLEDVRRFDFISVRERTLADSLQAVLGRDIQTVTDPTLLLAPAQWHELATDPGQRGYVLVYEVLPCCFIGKLAENTALQHGLHLVILCKDIAPQGRQQERSEMRGRQRRRVLCASPEAFLGWFQHADYVVTSSFHGTVFSILNQKPFACAFSGVPAENRMRALLAELGLTERICTGECPPNEFAPDYGDVTNKLECLRRQSCDFLQRATATVSME